MCFRHLGQPGTDQGVAYCRGGDQPKNRLPRQHGGQCQRPRREDPADGDTGLLQPDHCRATIGWKPLQHAPRRRRIGDRVPPAHDQQRAHRQGQILGLGQQRCADGQYDARADQRPADTDPIDEGAGGDRSADLSDTVGGHQQAEFGEIQSQIWPHDRRQRQHGNAVHSPDHMCARQGGDARPPRILRHRRVNITHSPMMAAGAPIANSFVQSVIVTP